MLVNARVLFIILILLSCKKNDTDQPQPKPGNVGSQYQGGVIAHILLPGDPGYDPNVSHGLIVTPTDAFATWGCHNILLGNTSDNFGTGLTNTINIVNNCATPNIAAKACYDLILNGYSDWYLPSHYELRKIMDNSNAIGGFDPSTGYWSSSESGPWSAVALGSTFPQGQYANWVKNQTIPYRAVRSF